MKINVLAKARVTTTLDADDQLQTLAKNDDLWGSDRETITQTLAEILAEDGTVDDAITDCEFDLEWRSCELTDEQWETYQTLVAAEQHRRRNIGQYDIFGGVVA